MVQAGWGKNTEGLWPVKVWAHVVLLTNYTTFLFFYWASSVNMFTIRLKNQTSQWRYQTHPYAMMAVVTNSMGASGVTYSQTQFPKHLSWGGLWNVREDSVFPHTFTGEKHPAIQHSQGLVWSQLSSWQAVTAVNTPKFLLSLALGNFCNHVTTPWTISQARPGGSVSAAAALSFLFKGEWCSVHSWSEGRSDATRIKTWLSYQSGSNQEHRNHTSYFNGGNLM